MKALQDFTKHIIHLNRKHGVGEELIGNKLWIDCFHRDVEERFNRKISKSLVKHIVKITK